MYLIPENVKSKFEFFKGFGWKELFLNVLFVAVGLFITFLLKFLFNNPITYLPLVFFSVGGFFVTRHDERFGTSLFGMIINYQKYSKRRNLYFFHFGKGRD